MISLPAGTRVRQAAGATDMRCGFNCLTAKVQTVLAENPLHRPRLRVPRTARSLRRGSGCGRMVSDMVFGHTGFTRRLKNQAFSGAVGSPPSPPVLKNAPLGAFSFVEGAPSAVPAQVLGVPDLKELLSHAVRETARDSGWSRLSGVGSLLGKTHTSFDARNYGFKKLSDLVRAQPYLDVRDTPDDTGFVHVELRMK